jgi:hypothetical protein
VTVFDRVLAALMWLDITVTASCFAAAAATLLW